MKNLLVLVTALSACASPPIVDDEDSLTPSSVGLDSQGRPIPMALQEVAVSAREVAEVSPDPLAAPPPSSAVPAPSCVAGVWSYSWTFGPGTCGVNPFVADIEALDDPPASYPSQCFVLPVNAETLFGTAGQFEIQPDGTMYGVPSVSSVNGCAFTLDYAIGPMKDACGEDRTVSWELAFDASGNGSGLITLLVDKEDSINAGQMTPYSSCEQQVVITATHL